MSVSTLELIAARYTTHPYNQANEGCDEGCREDAFAARVETMPDASRTLDTIVHGLGC